MIRQKLSDTRIKASARTATRTFLGIFAGLLIGASQASAVTLVGATFDATGVDGLVVDGTTYDVTFQNGDYTTIFASIPPTFLNDPTGANDAASALKNALNSLSVVSLTGLASGSMTQFLQVTDGVIIGGLVQAANAECDDANPCSPGGWIAPGGPVPSAFANQTGADYALFSSVGVAATPLPAALPLFAGGLGMVGFLARRKKKHAAVA